MTTQRFDLVTSLRMTKHKIGIDAADRIEALEAECDYLHDVILKAADAQPGQAVILCDDGSLLAVNDEYIRPDDDVVAVSLPVEEQQ